MIYMQQIYILHAGRFIFQCIVYNIHHCRLFWEILYKFLLLYTLWIKTGNLVKYSVKYFKYSLHFDCYDLLEKYILFFISILKYMYK